MTNPRDRAVPPQRGTVPAVPDPARSRPRWPFLRGVASMFDLFRAHRIEDYPFLAPDADARLLAEDWQAVGDDLRAALAAPSRKETPE